MTPQMKMAQLLQKTQKISKILSYVYTLAAGLML